MGAKMQVFRAEFIDSTRFRTLIELLRVVVRACFIIDSTGISLSTVDDNFKIAISLKLDSTSFRLFDLLDTSQTLSVGVHVNNLTQLLKPISRKDGVELTIRQNAPGNQVLGIRPFPIGEKSTGTNISTCTYMSTFNTVSTQTEIALPPLFGPVTIVPATWLYKYIKHLSSLQCKTLTVQSCAHKMTLVTSDNEMLKREDIIGVECDCIPEFTGHFPFDSFYRVQRVAQLSDSVTIQSDNPLSFLTDITDRVSGSTLGTIRVCIKTKNEEDN